MDFLNTRQARIWPEPPDVFHMMDRPTNTTMQLLPVWTGEEFKRLVNYPIVVEMWEKKKAGRQRRAWLKEFTEAERNKIATYHGRFYRWHLVSGTPDHVSCRLNTLHLLQRAVAFFAQM